jgi:hypothetical protein
MIKNIFKLDMHKNTMKKSVFPRVFVLLAIVLMVFSMGFGFAAENDSDEDSGGIIDADDGVDEGSAIDKAYECLETEIAENDVSLQESVFSTLALGSKSKLNDVIEDEEGSDCWPKGGCKVKETAQVLLAYERAGKDTEDIVEN